MTPQPKESIRGDEINPNKWVNELGDLVRKNSPELKYKGWVWLHDFISNLLSRTIPREELKEEMKKIEDILILWFGAPADDNSKYRFDKALDEILSLISKQ